MVLIDGTLKDLEKELGNEVFRIHRSALVNLKYIERLESINSGSGHQIKFKGIDDVVPVSRRHLPSLRKKLEEL